MKWCYNKYQVNIGNFRTFSDDFRTIKTNFKPLEGPKLAYQAPCREQITPAGYFFLTFRLFHVFHLEKESFFIRKKFLFAQFRCHFWKFLAEKFLLIAQVLLRFDILDNFWSFLDRWDVINRIMMIFGLLHNALETGLGQDLFYTS